MAEPIYIALTADVDPDANRAVPGRIDCVSPSELNGEVSISGTREGLCASMEILREVGLASTLFFEARTARLLQEGLDLHGECAGHEIACHSLKHEDFVGKVSGIPLSFEDVMKIIEEAQAALSDIFPEDLHGFRAPYTRTDEHVIDALAELGFQYDSSETRSLTTGWDLRPYRARGRQNDLLELALPSFTDRRGKKMTGYLWRMFEGGREPAEYVEATATRALKGGLLILAFHPWHLFVSADGVRFEASQIDRNLKNLAELLSGISELRGVCWTTLEGYAQRTSAER